ncbi:type II toxin-antitoxin system prevent-host-death family antitoxin [Pseudoduganella sp. FT93W]|uniref:Type II toxin-antitoxin system prevent-host-death family antitoxin n=1 Tax=Duganella fentianensis TaxID=2692177 RepID=A0A845HZC2_9BURK|nr:type II toxin-antitoxin system prevent-host-death family antitoxin [Duganella fentianensis]MYN46329.1 type II toxin-antitoxin system prevent-host-death family antitoxin [Duganella fentianensis]
MLTVELHDAEVHLTELVELAVQGESVIITKAGRPLAKIINLIEPAYTGKRRLGFLQGQIAVPDDFDDMGGTLISTLFGLQK